MAGDCKKIMRRWGDREKQLTESGRQKASERKEQTKKTVIEYPFEGKDRHHGGSGLGQ
jgi:hypothetical protein